MKRLLLVLIAIAAVVVAYLVLPWAWATPTPVYIPESTTASQTPVEITYTANEGVLISSGGKQVLIDGLHREYERDYAFLPSAEREKIETAKAPFHKIDLVLVSHRHLDHFHPESVGLHLQHNPRALLVSSQQVVEEIEKNFKNSFLPLWFLTGNEGQTVVRDHIKPKQIIAVHISPDESERTITQIKQLFPGVVAFTIMLEKRTY